MATPTTREELKQYALRKLAAPVIEINVDDSQLEDALDDSLQVFAEYHFDGVEKVFYKYEVTDTDITNGYIDVANIGRLVPMTHHRYHRVVALFLFTRSFSLIESGQGQICLVSTISWL